MKFIDNKVADINIAYIGGGSRGWAWGLMSDLASEEQLSGSVRLYDIDCEASRDNEIIGNKYMQCEGVKGDWHYNAVDTLKEVLNGADFVIISILPGTFKEMASDVHTPEKYGIYQSVGDSTGPGGILRALRTIPMYVEIAEAIRNYSPGAWVINYTNPMTLCVSTLYSAFPQIKAFGCCHEVFGTQSLLARMLKELRGIDGVTRRDLRTNVIGINHFTWIDKATYSDLDLMPVFKEFADKYYESGFEAPSREKERDTYFSSGQRVKIDLFKRYGIIAAAGDRHLAEFCPPWYLKNQKTVEEWQFGLTPVSYRVEELHKRIERAKKLVNGEEPLELHATDEEGVLQIKALLGQKDMVTNVNIPNYGQIHGIPLGCVVESNVVLSRNSIKPLIAGKLPDEVNNIVMRNVVNQQTVLKSGLTNDRELAFSAFANDPLMTSSIGDARKLFNEMIENTKDYLKI